jgi:hypothetical protein
VKSVRHIREALFDFHKNQKTGFYSFNPFAKDAIYNYFCFAVEAIRLVDSDHVKSYDNVQIFYCKKDGNIMYGVKYGTGAYLRKHMTLQEEIEYKWNKISREFNLDRADQLEHIILTIDVRGIIFDTYFIYPDLILEGE